MSLPMSLSDDLASALIAAQRNATQDVDPSAFTALKRPEAYDVQRATMSALGASVGVIKTAVHADGVGVAAPIYGAATVNGPDAQLPLARMVGLEVEVGVRLARDVASSADLPTAIDHFFLGIEVCGTRLTDRKAATPMVGLADNMSAFGYVVGARRPTQDLIDGLEVELTVDGDVLHRAMAKHGFGTVLASLIAYADHQVPHLPLAAGTLITTGSLCGLVPVERLGRCVARLGAQTLEFTIAG